ncbi:hypothetical protein L210DRAFT_3730324 [Boletus edulis BED1]|uniref:DUF6830 domain-containing protein n=1 Tax=Boletus edulis BED1 TaxID=1328754 RepID=A0AAD4B8Z5_BOLED|nr:hypothetical protein L210DRAFT_3730324 [Boletus edulis BED1]
MGTTDTDDDLCHPSEDIEAELNPPAILVEQSTSRWIVDRQLGTGQLKGNGQTFIAHFELDGFSTYRKLNLYYPFSTLQDWQMANFLLTSRLSMRAINDFLSLELSAKELHSHAEMLPSGPPWKFQIIPTTHPTKNPVHLYYHDSLECVEALFNHPLFACEMDLSPYCLFTTAERIVWLYMEWMSGDVAWEMQSAIEHSGGTFCGVILSSDKTNITNMCGGRVAHPLLISLANIRMKVRIVLELLEIAAHIGRMMSDPIGNLYYCFTPLASFIADMSEAAMVACVRGLTSPVSLAKYDQFGNLNPCQRRTGDYTLTQLQSIKVDPDNVEEYFAECEQYRLNGVSHPFFWTGPFLAPVISSITRDKIATALTDFHQYKHAILEQGLCCGPTTDAPLDHFNIPKMEFMRHVVPSINNTGNIIQWSADTTEHAHIEVIKDPAAMTNNTNYDSQICQTLDRDEKCRLFNTTITLSKQSIHMEEDDGLGLEPERDDEFNLPDLRGALGDYLNREGTFTQNFHTFGSMRRSPTNVPLPFNELQIWYKARLQQKSYYDLSTLGSAFTVHAHPPDRTWKYGNYGAAVLNVDKVHAWPSSGLLGHAIVLVRMIMCPAPPRKQRSPWVNRFLVYAECLDIVTQANGSAVEPSSGLHILKRATHASHPSGSRIPLVIMDSVCSIPSPNHHCAKEDIGTVTVRTQIAKASFMDLLCLLQLQYNNSVERLAAESASQLIRHWLGISCAAIPSMLSLSIPSPIPNTSSSPSFLSKSQGIRKRHHSRGYISDKENTASGYTASQSRSSSWTRSCSTTPTPAPSTETLSALEILDGLGSEGYETANSPLTALFKSLPSIPSKTDYATVKQCKTEASTEFHAADCCHCASEVSSEYMVAEKCKTEASTEFYMAEKCKSETETKFVTVALCEYNPIRGSNTSSNPPLTEIPSLQPPELDIHPELPPESVPLPPLEISPTISSTSRDLESEHIEETPAPHH